MVNAAVALASHPFQMTRMMRRVILLPPLNRNVPGEVILARQVLPTEKKTTTNLVLPLVFQDHPSYSHLPLRDVQNNLRLDATKVSEAGTPHTPPIPRLGRGMAGTKPTPSIASQIGGAL